MWGICAELHTLSLPNNCLVDSTPLPKISGEVRLKKMEVRVDQNFMARVAEKHIRRSTDLKLRKQIAQQDKTRPFLSLSPRVMVEGAPCKFSTIFNSIIDLFYPRCHGKPWDRSQFSVEAGGLFFNMADFRRRHHYEFLIRLLIG